MSELGQRFATLMGRLSHREQRLIGLLACILTALVLYAFVFEPLTAGRGRLHAQIEQLATEITETEELGLQILALEAQAPSGKDSKTASANFSLFSFVDKAAGSAVDAERIASMTPARRPRDDGTEETTVELKLTGATLAEVVALLTSLEHGKEPVYVKRLDMRKRYNDRSAFDVVLIAGARSRT